MYYKFYTTWYIELHYQLIVLPTYITMYYIITIGYSVNVQIYKNRCDCMDMDWIDTKTVLRVYEFNYLAITLLKFAFIPCKFYM